MREELAHKKETQKSRLHNLLILGIAAGVAAGALLHEAREQHALYESVLFWLDLAGSTFFMGALKMLVPPLIMASIISGVVSVERVRDLGRIGWRILFYYVGTTCVAVAIGLVLVSLAAPGRSQASLAIRKKRAERIELEAVRYEKETGKPARAGERYTVEFRSWLYERGSALQTSEEERARWKALLQRGSAGVGAILRDQLLKPMLENPIAALAGGNALGIIFFSLLLGIALVVAGDPAKPAAAFFEGLNAAILTLTRWLMATAPVCVFAIVASLVARHGLSVFASLGGYCATVIGGIACHTAFLLAVGAFIAGRGPAVLWRGIREAYLIAFTTRSSAATLPVTIRCVVERLGVRPQVANFTLPVGATMNMDGTALYEGVSVLFLLQIYGGLADVPVTLGGAATLVVFLTAVAASVGAAAVPNAGLVTMVLVANAVGLPVYYIPLIFAVDTFLDMFRTSTNVLGDVVGCCVIEALEKRSEGPKAVNET